MLFLVYDGMFRELFLRYGLDAAVKDAILAYGHPDTTPLAKPTNSIVDWLRRGILTLRTHIPRAFRHKRSSTSSSATSLLAEDPEIMFAALKINPSEEPAMALAAHALRIVRSSDEELVELYFQELQQWLDTLPHESQILESAIRVAFPVFMDAK